MYKTNDYIHKVEDIVRCVGIKVSSFAPAILREILHQEASANQQYKKEIGARFLVKRVGCCRKTVNRVISAFIKAGLVYEVRQANRHKHLERIVRASADLPTYPSFRSSIAAQGENDLSGTLVPCALLHEATNLNHPSLEYTTSVEVTAEKREGAHDLNDEMTKDQELKAPAGAVDSAIQSTEIAPLNLDCGEHHEAPEPVRPGPEVQTQPKAERSAKAPGRPGDRPEVPRATPAPREVRGWSREEKFKRESRSREAKSHFYRKRMLHSSPASAKLGHSAAKVEVNRVSPGMMRLGEILAGLGVPMLVAVKVGKCLLSKGENAVLQICEGLERLAGDAVVFDPLEFCRLAAAEYPRFLRWRQVAGDAWAAGWLRLGGLRRRLEACGVRCVDWAADQLAEWALAEFPNLEDILAKFPGWSARQFTLRDPAGFLVRLCASPERFREWLPRLEVILKPGLDPREVRKAEARALRVNESEMLRQANEAARREPDEGRKNYPLAYLAHYYGQELTSSNKSFFEETRESIKNSIRITFPCYVGLG